MDAKELAEKLRDKLRKYDDFVGLYLYGSQVTGKAKPDSDVDIVAVFEQNRDYSREVIRDAWDLEIDNDVVIDFHPMTPEQLSLDVFFSSQVKKGLYYAR